MLRRFGYGISTVAACLLVYSVLNASSLLVSLALFLIVIYGLAYQRFSFHSALISYFVLFFYLKGFVISRYIEEMSEFGDTAFFDFFNQRNLDFAMHVTSQVCIAYVLFLLFFRFFFGRTIKKRYFNVEVRSSLVISILFVGIICVFELLRLQFRWRIAGVTNPGLAGLGPFWLIMNAMAQVGIVYLYCEILKRPNYQLLKFIAFFGIGVYCIAEVVAGWKGPTVIALGIFYIFYRVYSGKGVTVAAIIPMLLLIVVSYLVVDGIREMNIRGAEFALSNRETGVLGENIWLRFLNRLIGIETLLVIQQKWQVIMQSNVGLREVNEFQDVLLGLPEHVTVSASNGFIAENLIVYKKAGVLVSCLIICVSTLIVHITNPKSLFLKVSFLFIYVQLIYWLTQGNTFVFLTRTVPQVFLILGVYFILLRPIPSVPHSRAAYA